jgi:ribosomal protein L37E
VGMCSTFLSHFSFFVFRASIVRTKWKYLFVWHPILPPIRSSLAVLKCGAGSYHRRKEWCEIEGWKESKREWKGWTEEKRGKGNWNERGSDTRWEERKVL